MLGYYYYAQPPITIPSSIVTQSMYGKYGRLNKQREESLNINKAGEWTLSI